MNNASQIPMTSGYKSRALPGPEIARKILLQVCAQHKVSPFDILGISRLDHIVKTRREFWRHLHQRGWSYKRIAAFSNRHHTTVMHGLGARKARTTAPFYRMAKDELLAKHNMVSLYLAIRESGPISFEDAGYIVNPECLRRRTRQQKGYITLKRLRAALARTGHDNLLGVLR